MAGLGGAWGAALAVLAALAGGALYTLAEVYDSFAYTTASLALVFRDLGGVRFEPIDKPGFFEDNANTISTKFYSPLLSLALSSFTGLSPAGTLLVPAPALLTGLALYMIASGALGVRSPLAMAALVSLGVVVNTGPVVVGSNYYISLGYALLFASLYMAMRVYSGDHRLTPALALAAVAAAFTYYTSIYLVVVLSTVYAIAARLWGRQGSGVYSKLAAFGAILFLIEGTPYYYLEVSGGAPNLAGVVEGFRVYVSRLADFLARQESYVQAKPVYVEYAGLAAALNRVYLASLAAAAAVVAARLGPRGIASAARGRVAHAAGLAAMAVFQVMAYFTVGEYNFSMAWLFAAAALAVAYESTPRGALRAAAAVLLAVAVVSGVALRVVWSLDNYYTLYYTIHEPPSAFYARASGAAADPYALDYCVAGHRAYALMMYRALEEHGLGGAFERMRFILLSPHFYGEATRKPEVCLADDEYIPLVWVGVLGFIDRAEAVSRIAGGFDLSSRVYDDGYVVFWRYYRLP